LGKIKVRTHTPTKAARDKYSRIFKESDISRFDEEGDFSTILELVISFFCSELIIAVVFYHTS
jgi:hypothetical protein